MTQIALAAFVNPVSDGAEVCAYCGKKHQDKEANKSTSPIPRDMTSLKKGGRTAPSYTGVYADRAAKYVEGYAPLVDWGGSSNRNMELGFKGAAHHCLPLSTVNKSDFLGEIKAAGYDPNRGENNIYLPLSKTQFIRARAISEVMNGAYGTTSSANSAKKQKRVSPPAASQGNDTRFQKHRGGHTDVYFDHCATLLNTEIKNKVKQNFCEKKKLEKEDLIKLFTALENKIWKGLTSGIIFDKYKLYNSSYLDPYEPWGSYPEEQGAAASILSPLDYLQITIDDPDAASEADQAAVEAQPPTVD